MELFDALAGRMLALEGVRLTSKKTMVSFSARRAFAYLLYGKPGRPVRLSLCLRRRIESPRFSAVAEPYPGRFTHHILVRSHEELDEELDAWVLEAYLLTGLAGKDKKDKKNDI